MRRQPLPFLPLNVARLLWGNLSIANVHADTTVTLEQPVHFTTAEGSDVVLGPGSYILEAAEEWLRVIPENGKTVDALLLEGYRGSHEEALTEPLAVSAKGETPDIHHLALLLPEGNRIEAIGSYSGIRSRGKISLLNIQRLKRLSSSSGSSTPTEYSTPIFGGSGGNQSYNLDCGNDSVMVGGIYKSGMWLDAVGIICQQVNSQTGALGNEFTRGPVGGSGGIAQVGRCENGKVVQGVRAFSGQFVNGILLYCSQWNQSQKAPVYSESGSCTGGRCKGIGKFSSAPSSDFFCPSGKVGKAFRGKRGIYIDSTRFICDFWNK